MKRNLVILFSISLMLSQAALAGVPDGLVAYWPFDEGEGTTAFDASGNGNDAALEGGAEWVEGQLGSALQFNGADAYVRAPYIPFDSRSHTVAMWVNSPRTGGDQMVVFAQHQNSSTNQSVHYRVYNSGQVRMGFYSNDVDAPGVLEADTWTHIAFVYDFDSTTSRIYINGLQAVELSRSPYLGTQGDTRIGQWNNNQWFNGMIDDVQVYHSALTEAEILSIMDGLGDAGAAGNPIPEDEAVDVSRDESLRWTAGEFANTHNVYFGTLFADVNDATTADPKGVLVAEGLTDPALDPGRLDLDQSYYWRVDEVNGAPDFTVIGGETWSFTTEPMAYPVTDLTVTASSSFGASGPEQTINGSGLVDDVHGVSASDMWISAGVPATIEYAFDRAYRLHELWIWNSNQLIEAFVGFGAKDVVIEHSLDGANWTILDGVGPLAQAPGLAGYAANNMIDFGGAVAQHVRITVNSVQGIAPQVSLSEVRFLFIPTFATRPNPDSGATNVAPDTSLSWGRNGREADRHEVLIGSDPENLSSAGTVNENSLDTLALDLKLSQTYHWRVDEVNEAKDPSTWEGTVWSFTTADTIPIDDMESYKDAEFLEIWATWVDGFEDPANGSLVGGVAGVPETDIVHGGNQSLPMDYDNGAAAQSEATRTFDAPMDWTRHGVAALVLFFQGSSNNTGGAL
ncbi:MAG: LamG domain-containing protein, partial [Planctomycetes bacterium]|nr:LamG domain-containing protein [Planctomycetota bacterium]